MLSTRDWYYSDLHRSLLKNYFKAHKQAFPADLKYEFSRNDMLNN